MMMMAPKAGSSSLWRASALVPKGFRSKKSLISRLDGTLEPQEQETCYGGSKTRQQQHITSILWLGLDWLFKVSRIFVTWFESLESAEIDFRLIVWCPTGNVYFVISSSVIVLCFFTHLIREKALLFFMNFYCQLFSRSFFRLKKRILEGIHFLILKVDVSIVFHALSARSCERWCRNWRPIWPNLREISQKIYWSVKFYSRRLNRKGIFHKIEGYLMTTLFCSTSMQIRRTQRREVLIPQCGKTRISLSPKNISWNQLTFCICNEIVDFT